jgi:glycosyltransferase involved in cell wall biosynthesis
MKEILLRCYPWKSAEEIIVVPWGALEGVGAIFNRDGLQSRMQFAPTKADAASVSENIRFEFSVTDNDFVLLTLSRLSREKGLEALLRALLLWEASDDPTVGRVRLFIGGEAAYMGGERYKQELQRLSKRLRRAKAFFVGHVDGARKQAFFDVADLFVMPSRHESYGLTLVEAMRAGLPVLTSNHYSAAEIVGDGGGRVVSWDGERDAASALKDALVEMAADREALQQMGKAAAQRAQTMRFSAAAAKIKELVAEVVATDARG